MRMEYNVYLQLVCAFIFDGIYARRRFFYALVRWEAMLRYVQGGCIEIDHDAKEIQIFLIGFGPKDYLFAGSDAGGERAAVMYSLVMYQRESCPLTCKESLWHHRLYRFYWE